MSDRFRTAVVAVTLAAGLLRFWALDSGLPHPMTRPDEEVILTQTGRVARGQLDLGWAIYPSAYIYLTWAWGAAGLTLGERLGVFPPADYLAVLDQHPERLLLVDRVLSAVAGTATVPLLMLVVRQGMGMSPAIVAGAILATSALHVRDSHAVKPDALLVLALVAALGAMIPFARDATPRRGAVVGALVGFAIAMKYPAVLLLLPAWVAAAMGGRGVGWRRLVSWPLLVVVGSAVGLFIATSPYLLVSPASRDLVTRVAASIFPQLTPAPDPAFAALASLDLPRRLHWWDGFVYHARFSLPYGAGMLQTLLLVPAIAWGLLVGRPLPLLAAVFALGYYAVTGMSPMMLARYMTPLVPVLALLEAGLLVASARRVASGTVVPVVVGVATLLLMAEPLTRSIAFDRVAARTDTRVLATEWMAGHLPAGSRVGVVGTHLWPYGVPRMPPGVAAVNVEPTPSGLAEAHVDYLLTHDHPLFTSRVDPVAMAMLAPRLRLLADFDPFVAGRDAAVFEVRDAFYVPMDGFGDVVRPGPHVRVYAVEPR